MRYLLDSAIAVAHHGLIVAFFGAAVIRARIAVFFPNQVRVAA
jgi:hypothetical protein